MRQTDSLRQWVHSLAALAGAVLLVASSSVASAQGEPSATPPMAGALPALVGTAWTIETTGTGNVATFLFCKNGTYEIISPELLAGAVSLIGTYKVEGSSVSLKSLDDGKVESFKMTWKSDVLELQDGETILRLRYHTAAKC